MKNYFSIDDSQDLLLMLVQWNGIQKVANLQYHPKMKYLHVFKEIQANILVNANN
jgi:hypothetical protein